MAVESGDVVTLYLFWAFGLAGVGVRAASEAELVHGHDHGFNALACFGLSLRQQSEMAYLGCNEEHGAGVLAGCDTGTASDALRGIHGEVGRAFVDRYGAGVGGRAGCGTDVASGLNDGVESGAVDDEVFDDREGFGAPDVVAVVETAHVELAGGDAVVVAVRAPVDVEAAHAADAFAAVVVEADGVSHGVGGELGVKDVEHLEERAVGRDVGDVVGLKSTFGSGVCLPPYMECEIHGK